MSTPTFSTVVNRVLDDLNRAGKYTAQAQVAINRAISHYKNSAFWFNEERWTSNTQNGQEWYELPSAVADVQSVVINVNNNEYPLIFRTYQTIEEWFVSQTNYTGYPTDFTIFRNELRLYPIPNGQYPMTLSGRRGAADLSADGATNIFLVHAEELIIRRAEADLAINKLQDLQRGTAFKGQELEALQALRRDTTLRTMTGHSRPRGMRGP